MKTRILLWGLFAAGCATTPAPVPDETVAEKKEAPPPAEAAPAEKKSGCSLDSECSDGQLCLKGACTEITKGLAECRDFKIDFGFNSVVFEPNWKRHLFRMCRCLRAGQSRKVQIVCNSGGRGTDEYTLQLGSKRAGTIQTFLVNLGVSAAQVDTVSYGENKTVCRAQDEACWAKNRRAVVKQEDPKK